MNGTAPNFVYTLCPPPLQLTAVGHNLEAGDSNPLSARSPMSGAQKQTKRSFASRSQSRIGLASAVLQLGTTFNPDKGASIYYVLITGERGGHDSWNR